MLFIEREIDKLNCQRAELFQQLFHDPRDHASVLFNANQDDTFFLKIILDDLECHPLQLHPDAIFIEYILSGHMNNLIKISCSFQTNQLQVKYFNLILVSNRQLNAIPATDSVHPYPFHSNMVILQESEGNNRKYPPGKR